MVYNGYWTEWGLNHFSFLILWRSGNILQLSGFCGQKSRIVTENVKNRDSARATISFWPCLVQGAKVSRVSILEYIEWSNFHNLRAFPQDIKKFGRAIKWECFFTASKLYRAIEKNQSIKSNYLSHHSEILRFCDNQIIQHSRISPLSHWYNNDITLV